MAGWGSIQWSVVVSILVSATLSLSFMQNDFAVEWFAVRSGSAPAAYGAALEVAREVPKDRAGLLAMGAIDGLAAVSREDTFLPAIESLPERPEFASARASAKAIAKAILAIPREKRREFLDGARSKRDAARRSIEAELKAHAGLLDGIAADLGMKVEKAEVLVLLVSNAPSPGAATYRTVEGPVCVVGLASFKPEELMEAVAHEATHALDELTKGQDTLLNKLRKSLVLRGVAATDPLMRDAPHAVVFAAAAARVRAAKGKDYVPYGESHGAYARMGRTATVVNEVWAQSGTADEKVAEIVRRLVPGGFGRGATRSAF